MNSTLAIALGGAIGASLRHGAGVWLGAVWATLAVNVVGSFLMGVLVGSGAADGWRLFLGVGLLGGFTTFSAFSLDAVQLLEAGRTGAAGLYIAGSVGLSLVALLLGLFAARGLA